MASIVIGGKEYVLPEMNFLAIERAWPFVVEATGSLDPMKGTSAALAVFTAALMEAEDFNKADYGVTEEIMGDARIHDGMTRFFKKKLMGSELDKVRNTMFELLREAGLEVTEGEAMAALTAALGTEEEDPILSPETAPDTSPSSSPQDAKAEAGTG